MADEFVCPKCLRTCFTTPQALGSHKATCSGIRLQPRKKRRQIEHLSGNVSGADAATPVSSGEGGQAHSYKEEQTGAGQRIDEPAIQPPDQRDPPGGSACDLASESSQHECFTQADFFYPAVSDPEETRIPQELKDTVRVVEFVRSCLNFQGLPAKDVTSLLQMFHSDFNAKNVHAANASELRKFEEEKLHFRKEDVSVSAQSIERVYCTCQ